MQVSQKSLKMAGRENAMRTDTDWCLNKVSCHTRALRIVLQLIVSHTWTPKCCNYSNWHHLQDLLGPLCCVSDYVLVLSSFSTFLYDHSGPLSPTYLKTSAYFQTPHSQENPYFSEIQLTESPWPSTLPTYLLPHPHVPSYCCPERSPSCSQPPLQSVPLIMC